MFLVNSAHYIDAIAICSEAMMLLVVVSCGSESLVGVENCSCYLEELTCSEETRNNQRFMHFIETEQACPASGAVTTSWPHSPSGSMHPSQGLQWRRPQGSKRKYQKIVRSLY